MLYRSYNFFNFIRCNIHSCQQEQFYLLRIALPKRHTTTFIKQQFVYVISNASKIHHNKYGSRQLYTAIKRLASNDLKSKNGKLEKVDQNKKDKTLNDETGQTIVELNEEKLGKLKERLLNIESTDPIVNNIKNSCIKLSRKGKTKTDEKNVSVEELTVKKFPPRKKIRVDLSASSLERNFITPARATSDFLLKQSDLESLPKTKRRSPYEFEPPITVYWRKDVEAKALEIWGSQEILYKEICKKDLERKAYQQTVFTVKKRLRDYRRELVSKSRERDEGLFGSSGKVVLTAIIINASNFLFKFCAWCYTGSHSMFSECIHSAADTFNQLILAYGIYKSVQNPDSDHPYGYTNMKYVSSLISGVGIFCVGTGLSIYHGIHGILYPNSVESFFWGYCILGGSLVSEGATLLVAINSIKKGAKEKRKSFREYVLNGHDPSVNVVLMEDFASVIGVSIASCCMGLTSYTSNPKYDAVGSLLVGGLLGAVASFIIYTNVAALVGQSIPQENLNKINDELESDIMIRAIHDVKGIDMGNSLVRYKAELDFDGRELTRSYLDKLDLNAMLEEIKKLQDVDELESFLLKHGENIVDLLGGQIDRIELKLKKKYPEIRHCDLEIL
ncbi:PREDICTED: zinc transporter 9 [Ceratosolen solmsi marchali]|uniref:Proton-coupled zinc antiporter SLC30A9, mitochondrial n=1 Tax=Ceratosolen solmsi marchali TaxID=326594 RepID=A0AAJ7E0V2_9HYME|nr:PREDICTED: zinc transporter 9 [Ceratosolen solmsi marchali]